MPQGCLATSIKTLIQACNGLKAKIKIYGDGPLLNNLKKNLDTKEIIVIWTENINLYKKKFTNQIFNFPSEQYSVCR